MADWQEYTMYDEESLQRMLSSTPDRTHLVLCGHGVTSLDSTVAFNNLHRLDIVGSYSPGCSPDQHDTISDFSSLRELSFVEVLTVRDCRHFDERALAHVATMPNLVAFRYDSFMTTVTDFGALASCPSLEYLCVGVISGFESEVSVPHFPGYIVGEKQGDRRVGEQKFEDFVKQRFDGVLANE